jgi:hypothetical protein
MPLLKDEYSLIKTIGVIIYHNYRLTPRIPIAGDDPSHEKQQKEDHDAPKQAVRFMMSVMMTPMMSISSVGMMPPFLGCRRGSRSGSRGRRSSRHDPLRDVYVS